MKKTVLLHLFFLIVSFFVAASAQAVCPVCTIAVGAGIGFSRWLGIDDSITGLWIGALIVSMSLWTINWLDKKNIRFKGRKIATFAFYYAIVIIPLYYKGIMGHSLNKLMGIDKILLGIMFGSIAFFAAATVYNEMKKKHNGKAYFPFQKIVMPVGTLALLSLVFYFATK